MAGGRDFDDYPALCTALDRILKGRGAVEIISGHATGADTMGERYAAARGLACAVFPADWKREGIRAGFLRNSRMLAYAAQETPLVVAFWDGVSHGTKDTLDKANAAGIECIVISYGE